LGEVLLLQGAGKLGKRFVLIDPFHAYAERFVDVVERRFGYQPLCVHTEGRRAFRRGLREHPRLRPLPHLFASPDGLFALGRRLLREGEVVGAIPFNEVVLGRTADLMRGLGLAWNDEPVLGLLRDKFALKDRLRRVRPALAVGQSIRAGADGLKLEGLPERFVLKPNSGNGNSSVGFFTRDTPRATLEEFVRRSPDTDFVVEEFHPGTEYFVNGQTDAQGATTVIAIFRYERVWANGFQVDWLTHKLPHRAPEFALLERFARRVVTGMGLRRSPFHLEVKLAGEEARMVEIGVRLVGNGNAFVCDRLHGGKLDIFGLAADHYLHDGAQARAQLDWEAYDASELTYVHGVSFERSLIYSLEGVSAVESHPRFAGWVRKPALGERLYPTRDLFSSPWCFMVVGPGGQDLRQVAAEARVLLQINQRPKLVRLPAQRVAQGVRRVLSRLGEGWR
jgi:hypothetical protein